MKLYDVAIIGGGKSGFTAALRLQKKGFNTLVIESHSQIGGCAGYFTKKNFSFDVGATTLVDFIEGGVGGNFFQEIGLPIPEGEYLDYIAWLPDRKINLYRDNTRWKEERLLKLGNSKNHIAFYELLDRITNVFWEATRKNIQIPIHRFSELKKAISAIGFKNLGLLKYYNHTMLDVLKFFHLEKEKPLIGLLSMLIEDTVHSKIEEAPFINATLGTTIRGAGLMRAKGGMKALWKILENHYNSLGGEIYKSNQVISFVKQNNLWEITTKKGNLQAKKIISSLPLDNTFTISPEFIQKKLKPYIQKNEVYKGGAIVVFLGIPEKEIETESITHHQILLDYDRELGNGNNMFISVSGKEDALSAPIGFRSVMISTHCKNLEWENLSKEEYESKKKEIGDRLIDYARRVYPSLATNPVVYEIGTPRTYQKFTKRTSVGGFKQTLSNSNWKSVPQDIGIENFCITGDNTWPGLGTVAGLVSGRIAAELSSH